MKFSKFYTLFVTMLLFFSLSSAYAAESPIKIARIPIIVLKQASLSRDTQKILELKISRAIKLPASDVYYIPEEQSKKVFQDIWKTIRNTNKTAKLTEAMQPLATKLDADIIICTVLIECNQKTTKGDNKSNMLNSNVQMEMIVFDNRTGEIDQQQVQRHYNDVYQKLGTSDSLAGECLSEVMEKINLQGKLHGETLSRVPIERELVTTTRQA